jgi:hypothetical protein
VWVPGQYGGTILPGLRTLMLDSPVLLQGQRKPGLSPCYSFHGASGRTLLLGLLCGIVLAPRNARVHRPSGLRKEVGESGLPPRGMEAHGRASICSCLLGASLGR